MKRLKILVLWAFASMALAIPAFGKPPEPPPPPPFVEASVPEGKALIYIYSFVRNATAGENESRNESYVRKQKIGDLLLAKSGPVGILSPNSYIAYVTEPGSIELWLVSARQANSKELTVEAVAGKIYYVCSGYAPGAFADALLALRRS